MPLVVSPSPQFGNVCDVQIEAGPPTTVRFTADPCGGPEALWFCFTLTWREPPAGAEVELILTNPNNLLGGGGPAATWRPVWRVEHGAWQRLPAATERALPDGRRELSWRLNWDGPTAEVAFCYPYGRDDVAGLIADLGAPWRADTIGVSQGGRPLTRLSNGPGAPEGARPGIYCMARQHAGETSGSWALDGFLRVIAAAGDAGPLVWCVPLANIDSIEQGEYGKDPYPYDLNRAWGSPPYRHETLAIGDDVRRFLRRCRPTLILDWHAPGACETDGVYTFVFPTADNTPDQAAPWRERVAAALADYASPNYHRVADYPSRWTTPSFTRWASQSLGLPAMSIEVPYGMIGGQVLTPDVYREIGRRFAEGVLAGLA